MFQRHRLCFCLTPGILKHSSQRLTDHSARATWAISLSASVKWHGFETADGATYNIERRKHILSEVRKRQTNQLRPFKNKNKAKAASDENIFVVGYTDISFYCRFTSADSQHNRKILGEITPDRERHTRDSLVAAVHPAPFFHCQSRAALSYTFHCIAFYLAIFVWRFHCSVLFPLRSTR